MFAQVVIYKARNRSRQVAEHSTRTVFLLVLDSTMAEHQQKTFVRLLALFLVLVDVISIVNAIQCYSTIPLITIP